MCNKADTLAGTTTSGPQQMESSVFKFNLKGQNEVLTQTFTFNFTINIQVVGLGGITWLK